MDDQVYGGSHSAPTAGTAIVTSNALAKGTYDCWVSGFHDAGTPAAAAEGNNLELVLVTATTTFGPLPLAVSSDVQTIAGPIRIDVPPAGDTIALSAVRNATASVVYYVTLVIREVAAY